MKGKIVLLLMLFVGLTFSSCEIDPDEEGSLTELGWELSGFKAEIAGQETELDAIKALYSDDFGMVYSFNDDETYLTVHGESSEEGYYDFDESRGKIELDNDGHVWNVAIAGKEMEWYRTDHPKAPRVRISLLFRN